MISANLKQLREEAELTQSEVAEKLNISPQSVSKWERGEALPSIEFLPKLAELYKCSIDRLFNKKEVVEKEGVEVANVSQDNSVGAFYRIIKRLYIGYKLGQKPVLNEKYKDELEFFKEVVGYVFAMNDASISGLQKRFFIGYAKAGGIMDGLEYLGIIKFNGASKRQIAFKQDELRDFIKFLNKID